MCCVFKSPCLCVFPVSETLLTHTKDVSEISGPLALQHFGIPARHISHPSDAGVIPPGGFILLHSSERVGTQRGMLSACQI